MFEKCLQILNIDHKLVKESVNGTWVFIMLGTNDALFNTPWERYCASMQLLVNQLQSWGASKIVILRPFDPRQAYNVKIEELKQFPQYDFTGNFHLPNMQSDNLHLNERGHVVFSESVKGVLLEMMKNNAITTEMIRNIAATPRFIRKIVYTPRVPSFQMNNIQSLDISNYLESKARRVNLQRKL